VADPSPAAASLTHDLDAVLLESKLTAPAPRAGLVSRAAVIATARDSGRRAVALSAPAGYGKSSLLAEWAAGEQRSVAWVSLDKYDDDPVALLSLISAAFERAVGGDCGLSRERSSHDLTALSRAAPRLASAMRSSPTPFVLMIDDLHELRAASCHDVLTVLVGGIPEGSQFVAASRHEQPHVPWLRASDDVIELGVEDLALDAQGAAQVFAEARVKLSPELAEVVIDRTEGWPVGLHLAALLARRGVDAAVTVSGDDPYVTDYLYCEALASLDEKTRRFLRRTAVLERVSADLGDSMLQTTGSQRTLRELEASHAFIIPLDRRRGWYRYHGLFRQFLEGELRRIEPEIIEDLHIRAADWFEANASAPTAVEHLLHTAQRGRAARLVAMLALPTYESGHVATMRRWLTELGDEAIAAYPPLAVLACWVAGLTGQERDAERWAAIVDAADFADTPADGTASFASARAMMRAFRCPAGARRSLSDAEYTLAHEPPWSPWRDLALAVGGEALLINGDSAGAEARFSEASAIARVAGNHEIEVISDAERALLAMDRGEWDAAAPLVAHARSIVDDFRLHDYAAASLIFPAAARLALHRGEISLAQQELGWAMRARPLCTAALPILAVRLRLHTALAYAAAGDPTTARHLVREIDDIAVRRPDLGTLLDEVRRVRNILDASSVDGVSGPPLTPAELRLLPYLQTHLSYPEIGARLFVSRNTVSTEISSIYRKLGVSSRTAAVERATAIGLLGG
jgi:LuxR family maltose regulon positive regulatory protein